MKKHISILVAVITALSFIACDKKADEKTDVAAVDKGDDMKARFRALNECFNTGNTTAIDSLLASDAVDHSEDTSMHLPPGPEGLKQMVKMIRESSPDMKSEIKIMAADDDILMVYGTMSGTNTGPMMGMPATNKAYSYDFVDIVRFDSDMKMKEHWGVYDQMKMMADLGLTGGPPQEPKKNTKKK